MRAGNINSFETIHGPAFDDFDNANCSNVITNILYQYHDHRRSIYIACRLAIWDGRGTVHRMLLLLSYKVKIPVIP